MEEGTEGEIVKAIEAKFMSCLDPSAKILQNLMMQEGTEGEIVKEINVRFMSYLDPSAKFYAFQMPVIEHAQFDKTLEIQFEEETNKFEMELPIASTTPSPGMEWMDTQPLTTVSQQAEPKRFAIGFLTGNCLRLYDIQAVINLQPLFPRKKQKVFDLGDGSCQDDFSEPNEGWIPLVFHHLSSRQATLCRLAMKGHSCKDGSLAMKDIYGTSDAQAAVLRRRIRLFLEQIKWCTFEEIEDNLKDDEFSAVYFTKGSGDKFPFADYPESCPKKFRAIVDELIVVVHGACFPKASPQHPEFNEFRCSVLTLFADKAAGASLREEEILGFADKHMERVVETDEFEKIMKELCKSDADSGRWSLRTDHD